MTHERNTPSPERDQRTEASEKTRKALGDRAVVHCPECGHELDLPPPEEMESSMAKGSMLERRISAIRQRRHAGKSTTTLKGAPKAVIVVDSGEMVIGSGIRNVDSAKVD